MDVRRFVLTFVWGASVALSLASVAGCALLDSLAFFGERPSAGDRQHTLVYTLAVLAMCLLSLASAALLRLPSTLLWILVVGLVFCAIMAYWALGAMQVAAPEEYPDPWWTGLRDALVFPTTWPLLACLLLSPFIPPAPRGGDRAAIRIGVPE
jgi:hypothetical protein